jgi:hypothetical protein
MCMIFVWTYENHITCEIYTNLWNSVSLWHKEVHKVHDHSSWKIKYLVLICIMTILKFFEKKEIVYKTCIGFFCYFMKCGGF